MSPGAQTLGGGGVCVCSVWSVFNGIRRMNLVCSGAPDEPAGLYRCMNVVTCIVLSVCSGLILILCFIIYETDVCQDVLFPDR